MRTTPFFSLLFASLTVLSLLSACSSSTPEPVTATPEATFTLEPTLTPTKTPTATPDVLVIPPEAVKWLQNHAVPFDTAEPGSGCEDLQPLLEMIGEARVVALGEATHGTHEFAAMKHRILECLVTEKGFNVFAMETGWAEANHINAYVQELNDEGNPINTLQYFMGSAELWDMIEWMHQYNQSIGDGKKISFRGFDMQFGDLIIQDLLSYLAVVDPTGLVTVKAELDCFLAHVKNWSVDPNVALYSQAGEEIQSQCKQGLQAIYDLFLENQDVYKDVSSPAEFAEAFYLVTLLMQNERLMAVPTIEESINVRDQYMAENITWLLEEAGTNARMVIWAHNQHVTPVGSDLDAEASGAEFIPMGATLRDVYGDDLIVVGFGFNRGSFWAIGFSNKSGNSLGYGLYSVTEPLPNSHDMYLMNANLPRFILDLRLMRNNQELGDWFREPRWLTNFGLGYVVDDPSANARWTVLPEEFDILIYFENTSETIH